MTGDPFDPSDLDAAILAVYRGPLEEFVSRRDALTKQLRASKRSEDANRVKALRKPSRMAWALDQVVFEDSAVAARLAGAIAAVREAQSGGLQARAEEVRTAVRAVADAGARAASRAEHAVESSALVTALRAVMGDAEAFGDFRAGRLVEIPEGGGLDLLAAVIPMGPSSAPFTAPSHRPEPRQDEVGIVRAELGRMEALLGKARARAEAAERAVRGAQAKLQAAEEHLLVAQERAEERRAELDRARQEATAAATEIADAERAVATVRARRGPASTG